ncbi:TraR/DksA family transcriptional regulator [Polaromonas sp.]|uniref:TraR/DksA family transcriptional regulator n=1 Tax=Polaromonas sp. TaxID=1869339 RepID=UPI002FC6CD96
MTTLRNEQLDLLRRALAEREAQLQVEVRTAKEAAAERPPATAREVQDPGEDAEEHFRHGLEHVDLQRDQEELHAIQLAQERVADGSYGSCIDCGQPIPFERLKAQPSASRCIACQTRFEQRRDTTPR